MTWKLSARVHIFPCLYMGLFLGTKKNKRKVSQISYQNQKQHVAISPAFPDVVSDYFILKYILKISVSEKA